MRSALLFGCGNHQRHFKWVYKIGFKNGAAFLGGLKRAARNASANGGQRVPMLLKNTLMNARRGC